MEYKTRGNGNNDPMILDVKPVTAPKATIQKKKLMHQLFHEIKNLLAILIYESPIRSNASGNDASTRIE